VDKPEVELLAARRWWRYSHQTFFHSLYIKPRSRATMPTWILRAGAPMSRAFGTRLLAMSRPQSLNMLIDPINMLTIRPRPRLYPGPKPIRPRWRIGVL